MKKAKSKDVWLIAPAGKDYFINLQKKNEDLLSNIKKNLPGLKKLLKEINGHWVYEDLVYRFYHNSFKVYYIQDETIKIVDALKILAPEGCTFNDLFEEIFKKGTGKKFTSKQNDNWSKHTKPLLEAFFHAKYFLDMVVKYGDELDKAPECLPSGWAGILELFRIR